jgi:NAD(P)-dependent dehydrogenase (short-subunit alcohol dehydrogenase family)
MNYRLNDKIAIVTGAGSGIGRAIALAMVREGARVVLVGRRKDRVEAVAREVPREGQGSAMVLAADVSKRAEIEHVLQETVKAFGGINVLVNNAGILHAGTAEQITEAQWDETFNINVRGLWLLSRAVLPHLRKAGGGSIINIASGYGHRSRPRKYPRERHLSIVCGNRSDCCGPEQSCGSGCHTT